MAELEKTVLELSRSAFGAKIGPEDILGLTPPSIRPVPLLLLSFLLLLLLLMLSFYPVV